MAKFKVGDQVRFVMYRKMDPVPKWVQESINTKPLTISEVCSNGDDPMYFVHELPLKSRSYRKMAKLINAEEYIVSGVIITSGQINNNIKEENTMKPNYNAMTPVNPNPYADPEEIEYDQKVKALQDEAEQKILDIRRELALALEKLRVERNEKKNKEREQRSAKVWKTKYDALVEAGFTTEQAWEMTMKCFELD